MISGDLLDQAWTCLAEDSGARARAVRYDGGHGVSDQMLADHGKWPASSEPGVMTALHVRAPHTAVRRADRQVGNGRGHVALLLSPSLKEHKAGAVVAVAPLHSTTGLPSSFITRRSSYAPGDSSPELID